MLIAINKCKKRRKPIPNVKKGENKFKVVVNGGLIFDVEKKRNIMLTTQKKVAESTCGSV